MPIPGLLESEMLLPRPARLFRLITILRDGQRHRAADLAAMLGVSERTIYRDMDTLAASGLPVAGERGVGYVMTAPVTLPPLNLTMTELEALHLGIAVVAEAADDSLQAAARSLAAKIDAALPEGGEGPPAAWGMATYPFADAGAGFRHLPTIRGAVRARQKLSVEVMAEAPGPFTIRPLKLDYWGRIWTVTAWCETRGRFEVFRVDHLGRVEVLAELFANETGRSLADYRDQAGRSSG